MECYIIPPTISNLDVDKYYDKIRVFKRDRCDYYQIKKYPLRKLNAYGYLLHPEIRRIKPDIFSARPNYVLHAQHTCGQNRLKFQPDLLEVIGLISTAISVDDLEEINDIWVTTRQISEDIDVFYNYENDTHYGKTLVYIVQK